MVASNHLAVAAMLALVFTLVAGLGDSYGFVHASRTWADGAFVPAELGHTALGFGIGTASYVMGIRCLNDLGVTSATPQTIVWFVVTLIGVALLTGDVGHWRPIDQVIALGVLAGVGWLLVTSEASSA